MKKTALLLALALAGGAEAKTVLRFAYFFPAASHIHKALFEPWKKAVEEQSNGELEIQLYPGQTLAKANATYDAVVKGVANIGATAQGYVNGRFPLTQITELPGMAHTASQGACVVQTLYEAGYLAEEYQDSKPLFMFSAGPGVLHTREKTIRTPKDLEGLRMRRPTVVAGDLLSSMGALPSSIPAPDIYTSLQRGVIDGLSLPWEGIKTFRLHTLVQKHTDVPFYSLVFVAAMNKKDYARLPPNLKKVIDDNSGMAWSKKAGLVFDTLDREGRAEAENAGDEIVVIENPLTHPEWRNAIQKGTDNYLNTVKKRGLDADKVYQAALAASKACGQ